MQRGSSICFPKTKICQHLISGWNSLARSLKQSAAFLNRLWCDSGCPSSGVLFQIKKYAKKWFKYEVRRLRRQQEHIKLIMPSMVIVTGRSTHPKIASVWTSSLMSELLLTLTYTY